MLALVKTPRIELSIHGERAEEIIAWIRKKYEVSILSTDDAEESVPVEETEFWKEMEKNRVGNLLAGARLKAQLTQGQLAKKLDIRQNMVSDYERGRRPLSPRMARRFSAVLQVREGQLKYGGERPDQSEKAARKTKNPAL
jgi:ribosome-binding protein aMBF1 (putative translation factor)